MQQLESHSVLNTKPGAGISSLCDSDCCSRTLAFSCKANPMKKIPLTRGQFALVDDDDYAELSGYKWYATKSPNAWYAHRQFRHNTIKNKKGQGKQIYVSMHRQIMKAPKSKNIDHKNGNGLDNRKSNLRFCTHAENMRNQKTMSCGYKGLRKTPDGKKWGVQICVDGVRHNLGLFTSQKAAAKEYDKLAKLLHGEFAALNFPNQ